MNFPEKSLYGKRVHVRVILTSPDQEYIWSAACIDSCSTAMSGSVGDSDVLNSGFYFWHKVWNLVHCISIRALCSVPAPVFGKCICCESKSGLGEPRSWSEKSLLSIWCREIPCLEPEEIEARMQTLKCHCFLKCPICKAPSVLWMKGALSSQCELIKRL